MKRGIFDITNVRQGIVAHGCNAQGVMGSGVAKQVRFKWPDAYTHYRKRYQAEGLKVGEVIICEVAPKLYLANCITQEFYGREIGKRYASPSGILLSLTRVCMFAEEQQIKNIYMPMIGCGLGGMIWKHDLEPILDALDEQFPQVTLRVSRGV